MFATPVAVDAVANQPLGAAPKSEEKTVAEIAGEVSGGLRACDTDISLAKPWRNAAKFALGGACGAALEFFFFLIKQVQVPCT